MTTLDVKGVASKYGGFWNYDLKDFCYMTNRYFPPDELFRALESKLRVLVTSYPSTNRHISSLIAVPLGLSPGHVVAANGASELIAAITSRFVERLAVPTPTFDEFVNRALIEGKRVSPYQLDDGFDLDVEDFVRHVRHTGADAALVINPNNPTGKLVPQRDMQHLLESLAHIGLVLVDESFLDFTDEEPSPSVMGMVHDFPNLLVLKSLSKSYGIPGLRLGFAVSGKPDIADELRSAMPIWSINSLAQSFLEELPAFEADFVRSCAQVRTATNALFAGLQTIPYLRPYPSQGNYVLSQVLHGFTGPELTARLFDDFGILINDCSGKVGLDERFVRMASRTTEENADLVQALQTLHAAVQAGEGLSR